MGPRRGGNVLQNPVPSAKLVLSPLKTLLSKLILNTIIDFEVHDNTKSRKILEDIEITDNLALSRELKVKLKCGAPLE